jgi:hypothetical protein
MCWAACPEDSFGHSEGTLFLRARLSLRETGTLLAPWRQGDVPQCRRVPGSYRSGGALFISACNVATETAPAGWA